MTEEEMIEREYVMVDRWCAVVVNLLEDNVFTEHAIGVDYLRKEWHAAGLMLQKHPWPVDNRVKKREKKIVATRLTKWTKKVFGSRK